MSIEQQAVGLVSGPVIYGNTMPLWLQPAPGDPALCYTAQDYRFMLSMMYPVAGVMHDGDFAVTQHGLGDNTVDVAGGSAVLPGGTVTHQGNYFVYSPDQKNIQPPTPPTTNPRYDCVILGIGDGQVTGTHQYRWYIQVVSGAEAAAPVLPAIPSDAILLATINRKVGVANILTADITSRIPRAAGGPQAADPPSNDLNNVAMSGTYRATTTAPATVNGPGVDSIVFSGYSDTNTQVQMAIELASSSTVAPRAWLRAKVGGAWGTWLQIPAMPVGSKASSAIAIAASATQPMTIAPALTGICSVAGDTYTATRAGVFSLSIASAISGNINHALQIIVGGMTFHANYDLDWSSNSKARLSWQGFLNQGETLRAYIRNNTTASRTITRYSWLTYMGG